jgi:hypothetical protein
MVSQKDSEPPSKRRKMEKPETVQKFKTASEISRGIRDVEEAGLTRGMWYSSTATVNAER